MMPSDRITVAVTGINAMPDNPAPGISVISCLRQAFGKQLRIVGLGYDAFDAGFYIDNLCDSGYLLPYPRVGLEAFYLRLTEIQQVEHIHFIIPCLDVELFLFTQLKERLTALGMATFLPTAEQMDRISKSRLSELAKTLNLSYPEMKPLFTSSFFGSCSLEGWEYPLVVKGQFYDARIVSTPEAGMTAFKEIASDWGLPILVQRYIGGEEYNLTALADEASNILGEVMMKKVAVTSKNKAFVGVTMYDQVLLGIAKKIIKELQWKGPFELEVIRDLKGGYHLIEINPRFPAWISLASGAGRNLPARLLELALGKKLGSFLPPSTGTYFVRYARDQIVSLQQIESMTIKGSSILKVEQ